MYDVPVGMVSAGAFGFREFNRLNSELLDANSKFASSCCNARSMTECQ